MKVSLVTAGTLNSIWQTKLDEVSSNDVIVFGFNGLGLVSYKKELSGETEYFQDVAKFSRQLSSVVICGCDTDTYGVFRHSAVVADNGKILGVSDTVYSVDDSEFVPGSGLHVYDTSAGRIGVLVGSDVNFLENSRVLALCDAEYVVCVSKKMEGFMPEILMRASSYSNGVITLICAEDYASVINQKGEIVVAGSKQIINSEFVNENYFSLLKVRRRGHAKEYK